MPMAGLGLCCRESAGGEAVRVEVRDFLLMGGRHLDGSVNYGNTRWVGEGVRDAVAQGVPREEIFVTTKVEPEYFGFEATVLFVEYALNESGLDHFDLVLLHQPASFGGQELQRCGTARQCRAEAWLALQRCQREKGWARHIGVSNFGVRHLEEVAALGLGQIAVNQIEYHPWVPETHRAAVRWCHGRGVAVTAYASLGSPGTAYTRRSTPTEASVRRHVDGIAERAGKSWRQVLLRWAIEHNVSVIPGTSRRQHMAENLALFDWRLSAEDMAILDGVPSDERGLAFAHFVLDAAPEGIDPGGLQLPAPPPSPPPEQVSSALAALAPIGAVAGLAALGLRCLAQPGVQKVAKAA